MSVDPRAAIGDFLVSRVVYGIKGLRYTVSTDCRLRVHALWRLHPERPHGIRQMILGVLLDGAIVAGVVFAVASHR